MGAASLELPLYTRDSTKTDRTVYVSVHSIKYRLCHFLQTKLGSPEMVLLHSTSR